jgi:hypothetical protein
VEIVIALCVVIVGFGFAGAIWLYLDKQYAARLAAANDRERGLALRLESERVARIEAQAIATQALAERNLLRVEVLARLDTKQASDGEELPVFLARLAERTATLVLGKLPMDATERERYAACASLGGLMSAHAYLGLAVDVMVRRADLEGPIYTLRYNDDAIEDDAIEDDDRDSDPSNMQ